MSQFKENFQTEGWEDRRAEGRNDRRTDKETLIHRTIPVMARGPKTPFKFGLMYHNL